MVQEQCQYTSESECGIVRRASVSDISSEIIFSRSSVSVNSRSNCASFASVAASDLSDSTRRARADSPCCDCVEETGLDPSHPAGAGVELAEAPKPPKTGFEPAKAPKSQKAGVELEVPKTGVEFVEAPKAGFELAEVPKVDVELEVPKIGVEFVGAPTAGVSFAKVPKAGVELEVPKIGVEFVGAPTAGVSFAEVPKVDVELEVPKAGVELEVPKVDVEFVEAPEEPKALRTTGAAPKASPAGAAGLHGGAPKDPPAGAAGLRGGAPKDPPAGAAGTAGLRGAGGGTPKDPAEAWPNAPNPLAVSPFGVDEALPGVCPKPLIMCIDYDLDWRDSGRMLCTARCSPSSRTHTPHSTMIGQILEGHL